MREEKKKKRAQRQNEARVERGIKNQSNISQETGYGKALKNICVPPN